MYRLRNARRKLKLFIVSIRNCYLREAQIGLRPDSTGFPPIPVGFSGWHDDLLHIMADSRGWM